MPTMSADALWHNRAQVVSMWQVYLPIAEMHVNLPYVVCIGIINGILAGTFGVGGTFFSIPALTFLGIPPAVVISSSASQMVASSASVCAFYWKNNMIDPKLALLTFAGSLGGSFLGAMLFAYLNENDQIDVAMAIIYVLFIGSIACFMFRESFAAVLAKRKGEVIHRGDAPMSIVNKLPFRVSLPKSNVETSAIMLFMLGFISSTVVALAGIGGGFIIIPTFIYLVRIPTSLALGTSNFIGFGTVIISAFLQSIFSKTVDLVLASVLIVCALIGIKVGSFFYKLIPPEELRLMLSCMMFVLIFKFLLQIFITPATLFSFNFV